MAVQRVSAPVVYRDLLYLWPTAIGGDRIAIDVSNGKLCTTLAQPSPDPFVRVALLRFTRSLSPLFGPHDRLPESEATATRSNSADV